MWYLIFLYKNSDVSDQSAASIVILEMDSSIFFYSNYGVHMFVWNACTGSHNAHSRDWSSLRSSRREKFKFRSKERFVFVLISHSVDHTDMELVFYT